MRWFLRYGASQAEFFVFLDCSLPFYPSNNPENQNFKRMKKTPGYHFTPVCNKWQSYDVMLLKYGAKQKKLFVILSYF